MNNIFRTNRFNPVLDFYDALDFFDKIEEDMIAGEDMVRTMFSMLSPHSPQYLRDVNKELLRNALKVLDRLKGTQATVGELALLVTDTGGFGRKMVLEYSRTPSPTQALADENARVSNYFLTEYYSENSKIYDDTAYIRNQIKKRAATSPDTVLDINDNSFLATPTPSSPTIYKPFSVDAFLSTYLKLLANMEQKTADVFVYMIKNADKDNIFHGNYDLLTDKMEVSRPKLAQIMTYLQNMNFIEKVSNGWKVLLDVSVPNDNGRIVIYFNKETPEENEAPIDAAVPSTNEEDKKEHINIDRLKKFTVEYYLSYTRTHELEEEPLNTEENAKLCSDFVEKYNNENKGETFKEFMDTQTMENARLKDFLVKTVEEYVKKYKDTKKTFKADFCTNDKQTTKEMYYGLIKKCDLLSGETKLLMMNEILSALNLVVDSWNYKATYRNVRTTILNTTYNDDDKRAVHDYFEALFGLLEDKYEIVLYED